MKATVMPEGFDPEQLKGTVMPDDFDPANITPEGYAPGGFSGYETIKNVPESAARMAVSMAQPVLHPLQTAKAVLNLGTGIAQKAIPGEQDKEKYADQAAAFITSRYGSLDAIKQTFMEDPVGVLADASSVLLGGGALAANAPGIVGKVGRGAMKVGAALDPTNLALNTGKAIASVTPDALPKAMYESSAKWRPSIPAKDRAQLTKTALEEGISPSASGAAKIEGLVSGLNDQIDALIDAATNAGVTIPKSAVYRELKKVRQELGGAKIDAPKDLRTINNVVKQFDEYMVKIGKDSLTPAELQDFKKSAYQRVNFDAKQGNANFAKNETKKAMARAAKKELEKVDPQIKELNAREGRLLELKPEIERAANRIDNRNTFSLDTSAKIGAGAAAAGQPGSIIGAALAAVGNPDIRSFLAIQIAKYQKQGIPDVYIANNVIPAMLREAGIQAGRTKEKMSWTDAPERLAERVISQPKQ